MKPCNRRYGGCAVRREKALRTWNTLLAVLTIAAVFGRPRADASCPWEVINAYVDD